MSRIFAGDFHPSDLLHRCADPESHVHHGHAGRGPHLGCHQRSDHGPHLRYGEGVALRKIPRVDAVCGTAAGNLGNPPFREIPRLRRGSRAQYTGLCLRGHHLHSLRHDLHDAPDPLRIAGLRDHNGCEGTLQALRVPCGRRDDRKHAGHGPVDDVLRDGQDDGGIHRKIRRPDDGCGDHVRPLHDLPDPGIFRDAGAREDTAGASREGRYRAGTEDRVPQQADAFPGVRGNASAGRPDVYPELLYLSDPLLFREGRHLRFPSDDPDLSADGDFDGLYAGTGAPFREKGDHTVGNGSSGRREPAHVFPEVPPGRAGALAFHDPVPDQRLRAQSLRPAAVGDGGGCDR